MDIKASALTLFSALLSFALIYAITVFYMRKRHPHVRVFISFSTSRSPYWSLFVQLTLRRIFYRYNIDFYDFTYFAKRISPHDINTNCQIIDLELAKADIYIRCYDGNVSHKPRPITSILRFMILNRYTRRLAQENYDYLLYETEIASPEYFSDKYNRIEICLTEEFLKPGHGCPDTRQVTLMMHSIFQSAAKFATEIAEKIHHLYMLKHNVTWYLNSLERRR
jgi:hypothetical protein